MISIDRRLLYNVDWVNSLNHLRQQQARPEQGYTPAGLVDLDVARGVRDGLAQVAGGGRMILMDNWLYKWPEPVGQWEDGKAGWLTAIAHQRATLPADLRASHNSFHWINSQTAEGETSTTAYSRQMEPSRSKDAFDASREAGQPSEMVFLYHNNHAGNVVPSYYDRHVPALKG